MQEGKDMHFCVIMTEKHENTHKVYSLCNYWAAFQHSRPFKS